MKNYYEILRIGKNAKDEDIKKSYRNLALKYHPDKNRDPGSEHRFKEILEAYQVLSDKNRRNKYDMERKVNLKTKRSKPHSPWTNPYDSVNTSDLAFNAFMNLFTKIDNANVYRFEMYGATRQSLPQFKERPIERDVFVTLEELNKGCTRKVKFPRLSYGGHRHEYKVLEVFIRPGCKTGTKIRFSRESNRVPGNVPGDVVIVVREKAHAYFERMGADLKFDCHVPLLLALRSNFIVNIPTLEGKIIQLPIKNEIIRPNMIKCIPNRGLPHWDNPKKRGNIFVEFQLKYPETMTSSTKQMILENILN